MAIHPADRDRLLMQMANEVQFLTNRLSEFESDHGDMDTDAYRDYAGHVHPSIARLLVMVKAVFDNDDSSIPAPQPVNSVPPSPR